MTNLIWLTIALPLIGVVINGLVGKKLERDLVGRVGVGMVGVSFIIGVLVFLSVPFLPEHRAVVKLWDFITIGSFDVNVSLLVDPLSMIMTLIVTGVGTLIHIYAIGYMEHDKDISRFFMFLNLFIASMMILVLGDNYLMLYVGWELVGVCSFFLIGFWFDRPAAADAGKKAFIVNRIGDFGFALGVFLIWSTYGTLNYLEVFELAPTASETTIAWITALLFIGAIGKSAQLPLYVWLPDAMEGPTPVSALIHAATMVTAGIYMGVRSNALYMLSPDVSMGIAIIGAATAIFAASIALVQYDLKRILAYSTVSQLGYMVLALGVGAYSLAIFHLVTHAFFKALLFMGAGSVMHAMDDKIDIRLFGGLKEKMPITFQTFVFGSLALAGFPLTSGFFSKDGILTQVYEYNFILYLVGLITAFMTAFYIFRAVYLTFYGEPRDQALYDHAHESPTVMTRPLQILGVLALGAGILGLPAAIFPNWIEGWLEPVLYAKAHHASASTEIVLLLVSSLVAVGGLLLVNELYVRRPGSVDMVVDRVGGFYNVLMNKYYVDEVYDATIVKPTKWEANFLAKVVDKQIIDSLLVDGTAHLTRAIGRIFDGFQTGYLRNYIMSIFIGCILVAIFFFVR